MILLSEIRGHSRFFLTGEMGDEEEGEEEKMMMMKMVKKKRREEKLLSPLIVPRIGKVRFV